LQYLSFLIAPTPNGIRVPSDAELSARARLVLSSAVAYGDAGVVIWWLNTGWFSQRAG